MSPEKVTQMTENRPSAQTSEGSIQVAAALALNIHYNESRAVLGGSAETQGDLTVRSTIDTDAVIYADASATKSTTGVGAAVAVNYVNATNVARIGSGKLKVGGDLLVLADIVEADAKRTVEEILADLLKYLADVQGSHMLIDALVEAAGAGSLHELLSQDPTYADEYNALDPDDKDAVQQLVIRALVARLKDDTLDTTTALMGNLVESIIGGIH